MSVCQIDQCFPFEAERYSCPVVRVGTLLCPSTALPGVGEDVQSGWTRFFLSPWPVSSAPVTLPSLLTPVTLLLGEIALSLDFLPCSSFLGQTSCGRFTAGGSPPRPFL